jgi:O-antigen/teichoic acid export membrane protein
VRRRVLRDSGALAVGSAVSGLLAYVFFSIATRHLGPATAAPVSVLWTYWAVAAAVLTFPLQHWIAHTVALDEGEAGVRHAVGRVALVVLGCAAVAAGAAWVGRDPLFHRDDLAFPALVAAVTVGSGFVGYVRGVMSARERFAVVAAVTAGENALRCVIAAVLALAGVDSPGAFGLALVAGQAVGLCLPSALRLHRTGAPHDGESPFAFFGGVGGGSLVAQVVLTGGPVVLALRGGSAAAVTALFVTMALFRAPYTFSLGVVAQVTGRLTHLVATGRGDLLRRIRAGLVAAAVVTAGLGALLGLAVGPWLVRLVFGDAVHVEAETAAGVAAGSAFAVANLLTTLTLIARRRSGQVLRSWLAAAAVGLVALALAPLHPTGDTVLAFAVAEAAAFALMVRAEASSPARPGDM